MILAQLNQTLEKKIKAIDYLNQRLNNYMVETLPVPKLERLSSNYDERFYFACLNNIELIRKYFNNSIKSMNQELGFVDIETGEAISAIANIYNYYLNLYSFEVDVTSFLKELDIGIETFSRTLDVYLGESETIDPKPEPVPDPESKPTPEPSPKPKPKPEPEPKPEPIPELVPRKNPVISTGLNRTYSLPDTDFNSTQGAASDENYYYILGRKTKAEPKFVLQVVAKNNKHTSFIAKGNIGTMVAAGQSGPQNDYKNNQLGHANDCMVLSQKGDEVTLLVASMEPNKVATCIVDVSKQTVRFGKRINLKQAKSVVPDDLSITSLQKLPDGKILLKGNARYWTADFSESGMTLDVFARMQKNTCLQFIQEHLGANFVTNLVGQGDWYANGYLYVVMCDADTYRSSVVLELIPQGPNKLAIPSNRMWYITDSKRHAELEKVWIENNQLMGNFCQTKPSDNFIAKLNWRT